VRSKSEKVNSLNLFLKSYRKAFIEAPELKVKTGNQESML
jgi:hypothetical protein